MPSGILVRLRPTTPWRIGPASGARDRVETVYHSDSLYSAVTSAMLQLGRLEEWLRATAANPAGSDVRFSSCFPFQKRTLFVVPPRSVWPPPLSTKLRYKGVRFVPVQLVASLLADQPIDETRWLLDGASECLLPSDRHEGPVPHRRAFQRRARPAERGRVRCALHRLPRVFAGLRSLVLTGFASDEARREWADPVKAALRLLSDSGFGGERSRGWGRAEMPEFIEGDLTRFVIPSRPPKPVDEPIGADSGAAASPAEDAPSASSSDSETATPAPESTQADMSVPTTPDPSTTPPPEPGIPEPEPGLPEPEPGLPQPEPGPPLPEQPVPEPQMSAEPIGPTEQSWWLLSLFIPDAGEPVDWSRQVWSGPPLGTRRKPPASRRSENTRLHGAGRIGAGQ